MGTSDEHHQGQRFMPNFSKMGLLLEKLLRALRFLAGTLSHLPLFAELVRKIKAYYKQGDYRSK